MVRRASRSVARVVRARTLATALILVVGIAAAGCGVSSESAAVDVGDALDPGAARSGDSMTTLPSANAANDPPHLVRDFFAAAVGGGDEAARRARLYLTAEAQRRWQPDPAKPLTIVRLSSVTPGTRDGGRFPVTVTYQIVGELTNQGFVEVLVNSEPHTMSFIVVAREENPAQLRIESIDGVPDGLFISDEALDTHYRVQPVYFWDSTGSWLVPDLRYLPLTMQPDVRPNQVVQWLLNGPSQWLKPAVRVLPQGTVANGAPVSRAGGYVVNLSSQAEADGPDGLRRLADQLRWSLRSTTIPSIQLQIDGQTRDIATPTDISKVNPAASLPSPQPFAVVGGRVVNREPGAASPGPGSLLASKENQRVVAAAIKSDPVSRELAVAAFVQRSTRGGGEDLVSVRRSGNRLETVRVTLPSTMGRPVFIPGTTSLLIAAKDQLYLVDPTKRTPRRIPGLDGVDAVAVAPDGRRVAFVVNGKASVAALLPAAGNAFTVGQVQRALLPREVPKAVAVAWQSEDRVLVAGMSDSDRPAMWEVTADSVIAKDRSVGLRDSIPTDVVAYPASPLGFSSGGGAVMVQTTAAAGDFSSELVLVEGLSSPFYAS